MSLRKIMKPAPPSNRQPVCYGYARVSSERQVKEGVSLDVQKEKVEAFYKFQLADQGVAWGEVFCDPGESAYKVPFSKRAAAAVLLDRVQAGDHVVVYKFDRAFRSVKDFIHTTELLMKKGVNVHYLDLGVSSATAIGMMTLQVIAALSEFDSRMKGERVKDALARRKERVGVTGKNPPQGWKVIGKKLDARMVPDVNDQSLYQLARIMHDNGMSYEKIATEFRVRGARFTRSAGGDISHAQLSEGVARCRNEQWTTPPAALPPRPETTVKPRGPKKPVKWLGKPPVPVTMVVVARPLTPPAPSSSATTLAEVPPSNSTATASSPTTTSGPVPDQSF